jgi:hypothetical protein
MEGKSDHAGGIGGRGDGALDNDDSNDPDDPDSSDAPGASASEEFVVARSLTRATSGVRVEVFRRKKSRNPMVSNDQKVGSVVG